VRLLMTSRDVIHSFYVPEFRIKQDVIPGRYTETWFEATKAGRYRVYCTEYCGTWHSQMVGEVVVLEPAEFDEWLARHQQGLTDRVDTSGGAEFGRETFRGDLVTHGQRLAAVHGCFKCHSVDGAPHIGPTWIDLYRRPTTLQTGQTIIADEGYLTESMMEPTLKLVKGYQPVMPSFRGKLTAPEAAALVEYIKSLRSDAFVNVPRRSRPMAQPSQSTALAWKPTVENQPVMPAINYLNHDRGIRSWLLTAGSQAHCADVPGADHQSPWPWAVCSRWPCASSTSAPVPRSWREHLQQDVHHAWDRHDLPVHDPRHPGHLRQLLSAADAGAKDVAFPKLNLLSVYVYAVGGGPGPVRHRLGRHRQRLDVLRALQPQHPGDVGPGAGRRSSYWGSRRSSPV
jgi:cytochrome c1